MSAADIPAILSSIGPSCRDNTRRQILLNRQTVNGIDFVEFESPAQGEFILHVHFLLDLPGDSFGLPADPSPIRVHGGVRVTGISVLAATAGSADNVLDVMVAAQGDFSPYLLTIGWQQSDGAWRFEFPLLDRQFSVAPVNFRPSCRVDFDCASPAECTHAVPPEPELDYLARDYASFRQMLLDLIVQRNPAWVERSPADLGMVLLELIAHEGDHLAYMQDAVAAEMFLDTTRRRESAKRHARLIDYRMHDGTNARTHVHFQVDTQGDIPERTPLLTGIDLPMRFEPHGQETRQPTEPPGPVLEAITENDYTTDPALAAVRVFETRTAATVHPELNELRIHTWGNDRCCLPRGQTTAHLYAIATTQPPHAIAPTTLEPGDLLLFEEVFGPETGKAADADPSHRQVVRLTRVQEATDPLFLAGLDEEDLSLAQVGTGQENEPKLPLVEVTWAAHDGLTFPVCLSTILDDQPVPLTPSVARGNIVAADHGRTVEEPPSVDRPLGGEIHRLPLGQGPLTMAATSEAGSPQDAHPTVELTVTDVSGTKEPWSRMPDLLASRGFDPHFVVDVDHAGRAVLRFGDGEYGRRLVDADTLKIHYRIGNGRSGNIGAEAIRHVVLPSPQAPRVLAVRNPLPATGGVDPESIEEVRQFAPAAFRTQQRAVTAEDYRNVALSVPGVAGAVAGFRWTGSWYTALVGIDPADPADLLLDHPGRASLAPALRRRVLDVLNNHRLAGYDLEVRGATYVPLDIALMICVEPGYFRGDVGHAVALALAGAQLGDRGLFDPANFTFGRPVYLSTVYAAVEQVNGVASVVATTFQRHGRMPAGELDTGVIPIGPWEIAQLDDDPNRMENGALMLTTGGGS